METPEEEQRRDLRDYDRMRRVAALAGEHFGDYVLIVRTRDGIIWRDSHRPWGVGACQLYTDVIRERGLLPPMPPTSGERV